MSGYPPTDVLRNLRYALALYHREAMGNGNRSSAAWEFIESAERLLGQPFGLYEPGPIIKQAEADLARAAEAAMGECAEVVENPQFAEGHPRRWDATMERFPGVYHGATKQAALGALKAALVRAASSFARGFVAEAYIAAHTTEPAPLGKDGGE